MTAPVTGRPARLRPIVAFAHHPWVEPEWMNRQQLLSRLGQRGWPVAYSAGALDWWQRGSTKWQSSPWRNIFVERDHIRDVQPGRLGARWRRLPAVDRFALARHGRFVRSTVASRDERIIAMLFDSQFYPYIEHLQPCDVVFHAYDAYAGHPGWTEEQAAWQAALVAEARLVTASSAAIARYLADEKVRVLPNGADVAAFLNATALPEPFDLQPIPRPRVGYVGAINRKVDVGLIAAVAAARLDWHWVLVGRVERNDLLADPDLAEPFKRCEAAPNVHFLGQKDRVEVPAYVGHMDVNTMCYRIAGEGWWKAVYPLKLHEYLATGLPVVSTPVDSVLPFGHVLNIAESVDGWLDAITGALIREDSGQKEMRCTVAMANSWDARVDLLESWFLSLW